jgi:hypothetical protein
MQCLIPSRACSDHRIGDGQKLAQASDDSHLLGVALSDQPRIKVLDHRIEANGRQRRHLKRPAHLRAATKISRLLRF